MHNFSKDPTIKIIGGVDPGGDRLSYTIRGEPNHGVYYAEYPEIKDPQELNQIAEQMKKVNMNRGLVIEQNLGANHYLDAFMHAVGGKMEDPFPKGILLKDPFEDISDVRTGETLADYLHRKTIQLDHKSLFAKLASIYRNTKQKWVEHRIKKIKLKQELDDIKKVVWDLDAQFENWESTGGKLQSK